jgi:hypothetical protein
VWWVQTWNAAGGYGPWSASQVFTVQTLGVPAVLSPTVGSAITYKWQAVPGATHYLLWVNDANTTGRIQTWYQSAAVGCSSGSTCSITPSVLPANGTIVVWVQAWSAGAGYSSWSPSLVFTF